MKSKIIILLLIFPLNFLIGQNSQGNVTNSIALLQNIINQVNIEKIESSGEIDGSYYFFKIYIVDKLSNIFQSLI